MRDLVSAASQVVDDVKWLRLVREQLSTHNRIVRILLDAQQRIEACSLKRLSDDIASEVRGVESVRCPVQSDSGRVRQECIQVAHQLVDPSQDCWLGRLSSVEPFVSAPGRRRFHHCCHRIRSGGASSLPPVGVIDAARAPAHNVYPTNLSVTGWIRRL